MALPPSIRRSFAAAIAGAAMLVPATAARADHGEPFTSPTLTRYLEIADQHWAVPAPRCTADDGQPIAVHAVLYDDPDASVVAAAEQPGCRIWLDRNWWPAAPSERDCITIVHEWGHLLGYGHSSDQNSLMFSYPTAGAPECAFFGRRASGRRARRGREASQAARKRCLRARHRRERALTGDAWSPDVRRHARRNADRRATAANIGCRRR